LHGEGLDYLVNNAGFGQMAMFADTSEELYDTFARVILKGPYFLTQALLPLIKDGGAIVNVASNSATTTGLTPGYSAYATMKGGLITLTRCLAKELAARGIRVNAVSPGPTRTGMMPDTVLEQHPQLIASMVEQTALSRLGESGDIGDAVAALLSDDCRNTDVLNPLPDGAHLLCTIDEPARSVTFHRVEVDVAGQIAIAPLLTCELRNSGMFPGWRAGEFDLFYDTERDDGSYDLVLGPRHPYEEGAQLFVIPDVIPPPAR